MRTYLSFHLFLLILPLLFYHSECFLLPFRNMDVSPRDVGGLCNVTPLRGGGNENKIVRR